MVRKRSISSRDEGQHVAGLGPSRHARGKRRRRRIFLALLLLVGVAIAMAPTIVSVTPLRNQIFALAVPRQAGVMTCQSARFSWFGVQTISGLQWNDAEGNPLLAVKRASLERSLASLAISRRTVGSVIVSQPTLHVDVRVDGSNWEDALAELSADQDDAAPSSDEAIQAQVEVVDGQVLGRDLATGQSWRVDALTASAATKPGGGAWTAFGSGRAAASAASSGEIRFRTEPMGSDGRFIELFTEGLPLQPLQPWLARSLPGCRIAGSASADVRISWTPQPSGRAKVSASGKLGLADASMTADAMSGDVLQIAAGAVSTQFAVEGDALTVDRLLAESDWFSANITGMIDVDEIARGQFNSLAKGDASVTAQLDLVQLARQLPRTLQLREGVRIDAGTVDLHAGSGVEDEVRHWEVMCAIEGLHGSDGVREIQWSKPVRVGARISEAPEGPAFDRLRFEAPSATAKIVAAPGGYDGQFRFDLDQVAREINQFVNLEDWRIRGLGSGEFTLRESSDSGILVGAQVDLRNIDVRRKEQTIWTDSQLTVDLQSAIQRSGASIREIDSGTLKVQGAGDQLTVELQQPISLDGNQQHYEVRIQGSGPIEAWAGRLRLWFDEVPDEIQGTATLDAQLTLGSGFWEASHTLVDVANLRTAARIDEPRLRLQGDCRWNAAASSLTSSNLELTTSTVALRSQNMTLQIPAAGAVNAHGEIAFRTNLERLAQWLNMTSGPEAAWPRGHAVGSVKLASHNGEARADISLTGDNVEWVRTMPDSNVRPAVVWSEPHVEIGGVASYAPALDQFQATNVTVRGQSLQMSGSTSIEKMQTAPLVRGDVQVQYAADALARWVTDQLGPGVQLQGNNTTQIQFTGNLKDASEGALASTAPAPPTHWSRRWNVVSDTQVGSGNVYGLPLGPIQLQTELQRGQLLLHPINVTVGEQGRVAAQGRIVLDPEPATLELAAGPFASNVAISPEVSETILKYAAPILVGSTRTQGEFSVELDGARVPLDQPQRADAGGRLLIHQLRILPGPTTQPLVAAVRQLAALSRGKDILNNPVPQGDGISVREQKIDVRILDGKVHHRNFEFLIDDVPVTSSGWVALDETIYLQFEVPVQEKWVRGSSTFRSLEGQVIRIPVEGTLSKWRVDDSFLTDLVQLGARQVIGNEVNRALDRLLRGK